MAFEWDPNLIRGQLFVRPIVGRLGIVHRRALLERAGGFHELLPEGTEWDLLKRFARLGAEFVFLKLKAGRYYVGAVDEGSRDQFLSGNCDSRDAAGPAIGAPKTQVGDCSSARVAVHATPPGPPLKPVDEGSRDQFLSGNCDSRDPPYPPLLRGGEKGSGRMPLLQAGLAARMEKNRREGKPLFGERSGWMFPKRVERILFASVHCLLDYTNGASLTVLQTLRWLNEHGFSAKAFCLCDHADPEREHLGVCPGPRRARDDEETEAAGCGFYEGTETVNGPHPGPFPGGEGETGRGRTPLRQGEIHSESASRQFGGSPLIQGGVWQTAAVGIPLTVRHVAQNDPWRVTGDTRKFLDVYERLLTEQRPDVVVTYGGDCLSLAMMEAAKHRDIPVVFWLHNFGYLSRSAFQFVDRVIVPSEFSREFYWQALGLDCRALANFIDWERVLVSGRRAAEGSEVDLSESAKRQTRLGPTLRPVDEGSRDRCLSGDCDSLDQPCPTLQPGHKGSREQFLSGICKSSDPAGPPLQPVDEGSREQFLSGDCDSLDPPCAPLQPVDEGSRDQFLSGDCDSPDPPCPPLLRGGDCVTFVNPEPVKGVFVFAAIAAELAVKRPDIPLLVVEGRTPSAGLKNIGIDLARFANVRVTPRTADPREFYAVTKLFLMPSLWNESFGLVAAEAMINGIPVLASNRGALPEVVGDGGFLFDIPARFTPETQEVPSAAEVQAWVETIVRLWDDPEFYAEASRRALARAQIWHPERLGPRYEEFFANVSPQPCPPIVPWHGEVGTIRS